MTSPIQIPTLRPTNVVKEPGLGDQGEQFSQIARLLMAKGQLALENEKFQNEVAQQKQKKATLDQLGQGLSQIFSGMQQTPSGVMGATSQAIPLLGGAGESVAPLIGQLTEQQKQVTNASTTSALGLIIRDFSNTNMRDPLNQAEFLSHVAAVAPEHMTAATEMLKPLQGNLAFHNVPGVGLWAGDPNLKLDENGKLLRPQGSIIVEAIPKDPATKERQSNSAALALQRISNLEHNLKDNPDANVEPTTAAGAENIAKSGVAQAAIGGLGALGIGAGTPEAIATAQRTPAQRNFKRDMSGFAHAYFIWLGGSPRSYVLYKNILDSFYPGAEAGPEARAEAWKELQSVKPLLLASLQGKKIDFTKLPFFNEIQAQEAKAGGAGQAAPETPEAAPISTEDLLQGVPK